MRKIFKKSLHKYTEYTRLSYTELSKSLHATRERGYAISEEEYEDGINAVAAPILDVHQHPIAAIAIVGPAFRLPSERMKRVGKSVKATADQIAQEIATTH